jgi:hypothetical protein
MIGALEALPGVALVVLLFLAGAAGWGVCRVFDRVSFYLDDARDLTVRGGRTAWRGLKRLVVVALVGCGLVFVVGIAYLSTH